MTYLTFNILDLSDEILLIILKKLHNIDVLYSLMGVSKKIDQLVRDTTFTRSVDLTILSNKENNLILDRFCFDIIPQLQNSIECITLDPLSMDHIFCTGNYFKLHKLTLMNLPIEMASRIFNDELSFIHRLKQQITHFAIMINDDIDFEEIKNIATNIFTNIFIIFKNLTHLDFQLADTFVYSPLIRDIACTTCSSSNIVHLNVRVRNFDDCLCLLDGRLSRLCTFIVKVDDMINSSMSVDKTKILSNLRCFSLVSSCPVYDYDNRIVPVLRQMILLEKFTLSLYVQRRTSFIDGTQLNNDVLNRMPHLQTFIFDIVSETTNIKEELLPSCDDIRRTFIEIGYHIDCYINYSMNGKGRCHIYSLPFTMDHMINVTNNFPGGLFINVRNLRVNDSFRPFEHEFFVQISRSFPLLNRLRIVNVCAQQNKAIHKEISSIAEFSHLVKLSLNFVHTDYIKQFLFDTNTRLPSLKILDTNYEYLRTVTDDFTNNAARVNCAKLEHIIFDLRPIVYSENFFCFFPSYK